jgi:hypothetical protein
MFTNRDLQHVAPGSRCSSIFLPSALSLIAEGIAQPMPDVLLTVVSRLRFAGCVYDHASKYLPV